MAKKETIITWLLFSIIALQIVAKGLISNEAYEWLNTALYIMVLACLIWELVHWREYKKWSLLFTLSFAIIVLIGIILSVGSILSYR